LRYGNSLSTGAQHRCASLGASYAGRYKEIKMDELQGSIIEALKLLIQYDSDLIRTQPKEECINHKLAQYLELILFKKRLLNKHDVDIEYNKYKENEKKSSDGRNIRPDIIVHERKSGNRNNLIVIEAKINYDAKGDRDKVEDLVKSENFSYAVGAVISYFPTREYVKIKFFGPGYTWKRYLLNKKDFTIRETKK